MKMNKALAFAASLVAGFAVTVHAASTLNTYLTETPTGTAGVYTVSVYAEVSGTAAAGDGDGGLAGYQFDIAADGNASPSHGSGAKANQVTTTWSSTVSADYSTIPAVYTADGKGYDAIGADFYDTSSFDDESFALNNYQLIGSQTWTLTNNSVAAPLTLTAEFGTSYDDNSSGSNYHDNIVTYNPTGVTLPAVPEPASLGLLGLGALGLTARRRRA